MVLIIFAVSKRKKKKTILHDKQYAIWGLHVRISR
jgi:hypothetical protein